jgi:4-amino-4-deoxy-L-arabinose transferase-like glycosyltransferase
LLLVAVYLARTPSLASGASWRYGAGCGALVGLSLLTKQSGVPLALALGVLFTLTARRQVVPYVLGVCLVVGVAMLLLTAQSGRWPLFYLWDLPRRHEFKAGFAAQFWSQVVRRFAVPIVVGPFYFFALFRARDYRRLVFYLCVCLGLVLTAWLQDANVGTGRNVEMPAYAAFALLFGLALSEAIKYLSVPSECARTGRAYVVFMAVAQFAIVLYNPRLVVPYRSDLWAAQRMGAALAGLPGPTFAGSYQGYVDDSAQAPDLGALRELEGAFGGTGTDEAGYWEGLFSRAMAQRQVTYIVVDPENAASIVPTLAKDYGYRDVGPLFPPDDIFWAWRTAWTPKAEVYVASESRPTVQR